MAKATRRLKRTQVKHEEEEHDDFQETLDVVKKWIVPVLIVGTLLILAYVITNRVKDSSYAEIDRVATILRNEEDPEKLLELLKEHAEHPEVANQLLRTARMQYDAGNFQGALATYDEVTKRFPDHPFSTEATFNKAQCKESNGDILEAKEAYEAFLKGNPDNYRAPIAELAIARCLLQTEPPQAAKAKELFNAFLEANPESPFKAVAEDYAEHADRLARAKES